MNPLNLHHGQNLLKSDNFMVIHAVNMIMMSYVQKKYEYEYSSTPEKVKEILTLLDKKEIKNSMFQGQDFTDFFQCAMAIKNESKILKNKYIYNFTDNSNFYYFSKNKELTLNKFINNYKRLIFKENLNYLIKDIINFIKINIKNEDLYFCNYYNNIVNVENKFKQNIKENHQEPIDKSKTIFTLILKLKQQLLKNINEIVTKEDYLNNNKDINIEFLKELYVQIPKCLNNIKDLKQSYKDSKSKNTSKSLSKFSEKNESKVLGSQIYINIKQSFKDIRKEELANEIFINTLDKLNEDLKKLEKSIMSLISYVSN
ncbi:MAG: hypothetical protein GY830_10535 [Bacteroidetes bacterium]|nr:hypothetical protein [Bacteroidota bacterium]